MKALLIFILSAACLGLYIANREKGKSVLKDKKLNLPAAIARVNFEKEILPIFQSKCNPCHFPGGKMYAKMPFDSSSTILQHREGILRRIKDEKQNSLLRKYIEENKAII